MLQFTVAKLIWEQEIVPGGGFLFSEAAQCRRILLDAPLRWPPL